MVKTNDFTLADENALAFVKDEAPRTRTPQRKQQVAVINHRQANEEFNALVKLTAGFPSADFDQLPALKELVAALVPVTYEQVDFVIDQLKRSVRWPSHEVVEDRESAVAFLKRRVMDTGVSSQVLAVALASCRSAFMPLDLAERCDEVQKTVKRAKKFIVEVEEAQQERLQEEVRQARAEREDKEWQEEVVKWVGPTRLNEFLLAERTIKRLLRMGDHDIRRPFGYLHSPRAEQDFEVALKYQWVTPLIRYFVSVSEVETPPYNGAVTQFQSAYHDIRRSRTLEEAESKFDRWLTRYRQTQ